MIILLSNISFPKEGEDAIVFCKECKLIDNCPIQKEKDKHEGNPFKKILGCCNGVRPIIGESYYLAGSDICNMVKGDNWI